MDGQLLDNNQLKVSLPPGNNEDIVHLGEANVDKVAECFTINIDSNKHKSYLDDQFRWLNYLLAFVVFFSIVICTTYGIYVLYDYYELEFISKIFQFFVNIFKLISGFFKSLLAKLNVKLMVPSIKLDFKF